MPGVLWGIVCNILFFLWSVEEFGRPADLGLHPGFTSP